VTNSDISLSLSLSCNSKKTILKKANMKNAKNGVQKFDLSLFSPL